MHVSPETTDDVGSISAVGVPRYRLYGEDTPRPDWFVNVEPIDRRCRERGWVIAPHIHPRFMQVVLCGTGGGTMSVDGETVPFADGSVMVVPPHHIHGFDYLEATEGWVLTIEHHYLADLIARAPALKPVLRTPGVFAPDPAALPALRELFPALAAELREARTGSAIGAEIHLLSILLCLLRHWPLHAGVAFAPPDGRSRIVDRFRTLVEQRYRDQPRLPAIARELGISVSQLRHACTSVTGLSPLGLIHDRTVAEAKRCLAYSTMSIAEVADWLGFSDAAYFSRFFTREAAQSPTAYRRRQGAPADPVAAETPG